MFIHINAGSRNVVIDDAERQFAFATEYLRRLGLVELWFETSTNTGHTVALDGTITPISTLPHGALLRRVFQDWRRPGVFLIPWRTGRRVYVTQDGKPWYIASAEDFEAAYGSAFPIPQDAIARFWFPGHAHYKISTGGTVTDYASLDWAAGAAIHAALDDLLATL